MDVEQKKRLFEKLKRQFQKEYNELLELVERLKKKGVLNDNWLVQPAKGEYVMSLGDVRTVVNALEVFKSLVEDRIDCAERDSTEYCELDVQYEHIKKLIGFFEDVLYSRSSLIFKKSNETV
jgi:hypothetical protein